MRSRAGATGVSFDHVDLNVTEQFRKLYPDRTVVAFAWLKPEGAPGRGDFATAPGQQRGTARFADNRQTEAQAWDEDGNAIDPATFGGDDAFGTGRPGDAARHHPDGDRLDGLDIDVIVRNPPPR